MRGPTKSFTAINPPAWLQQDLPRTRDNHPNVNGMFFFVDDLPGLATHTDGKFPLVTAMARQREFGQMCYTLWGVTPEQARISSEIALSINAQLCPDGTSNSLNSINPLTGLSNQLNIIRTAPTYAAIVLPSRHYTTQHFTSSVTGIPFTLCAELPDVIPHRGVAGHELKHLELRSQIGMHLHEHMEEGSADSGGYSFCVNAGDKKSAEYLYEWRVLSNFLSGLKPEDVKYWNSLDHYNLGSGIVEECAANLELKLRASMSEEAPPHNQEKFIKAAFDDKYYPSLHACFNGQGPSPISKLRNLEQQHGKSDYRYETSQQLAEVVLKAAHRLAPGVFAPIYSRNAIAP